jgi:glycosyl transferase, family 25
MKRNYIIIFVLLIIFFIGLFLSTQINKKEGFSNTDIGIDKVIYINLDKRTDRKEQIEGELQKMGITEYERFPAIANKNGALGCSKSHLEIIKLAKQNGYKNVLVLEDDFQFIVDKDVFYEEIENLSKTPYDACLLAYNTPNYYDSPYPFLHRIKDAQTTSAYIVNSHYYDTLINQWEKAVKMFEQTDDATKYTCDQSWKPLQEKDDWYCFKKRIGVQRESYSDIQMGVVNPNV